MPHYADGTEAKVGDQVTGKLYNTPGIRAGTIISITPGQESCNAMVGFLVVAKNLEEIGQVGSQVRMAVLDNHLFRTRNIRGEAHGSAGDTFVLVECADFCAVNELTKVGE